MSNPLVDALNEHIRAIVTDDLSDRPTTRHTTTVGPGGDYESVANAQAGLGADWHDAGGIYLLDDYEPDTYPLRISHRCRVHGGFTKLTPPDDKPAVEIDIADAPANRPPGPHIEGLEIRGGSHGIKHTSGRYTTLSNIDVNEAGVGFAFADKDENAVNTHHLRSCVAEKCGTGFRFGSGAHAINAALCHAYFSSDHGVHVHNDNYCSSWIGGSIEGSNGHAVELDGAKAFSLRGAYIENNGRSGKSGTSAIHATGDTIGAWFGSIYGNGYGDPPNTRLFDFRAGTGFSVGQVVHTNYRKGLLYADSDVGTLDVYPPVVALDEAPMGHSEAETTRSHGVQLE